MMTKLALSSVKSLMALGLPNSSQMAKTALSFGVVLGFDTLQNTTVIQNNVSVPEELWLSSPNSEMTWHEQTCSSYYKTECHSMFMY